MSRYKFGLAIEKHMRSRPYLIFCILCICIDLSICLVCVHVIIWMMSRYKFGLAIGNTRHPKYIIYFCIFSICIHLCLPVYGLFTYTGDVTVPIRTRHFKHTTSRPHYIFYIFCICFHLYIYLALLYFITEVMLR